MTGVSSLMRGSLPAPRANTYSGYWSRFFEGTQGASRVPMAGVRLGRRGYPHLPLIILPASTVALTSSQAPASLIAAGVGVSSQISHLVQRPDFDLARSWHGIGAALHPGD